MAEPIVVGGGDERDNRRVLKLAGVAAVVLLAVVVLPGLLFGGGDDAADDPFPPPVVVPPTPSVEDTVAETFQVFTSKNPFTPLLDVGGDATGGESTPEFAAPPVVVEDDAEPFDDDFEFDFGDEPADGGGEQPPNGGETTTSTTAPARQPDRVSLLEVFRDQSGRVVASIRVNDVTHQVARGEEFAQSYRVVGLDPERRCADLLFGDDPFHLCEGDEVRK